MAGLRGVMISDGHTLEDLPRGTQCVRWSLKPDGQRKKFTRALANLGIAPAPVLAGESFPGWNETWVAADYAVQLQAYEADYGQNIRRGHGWVEVGNEPDGQPNTASWNMSAAAWLELASACRATFGPDTTLVLGGGRYPDSARGWTKWSPC